MKNKNISIQSGELKKVTGGEINISEKINKDGNILNVNDSNNKIFFDLGSPPENMQNDFSNKINNIMDNFKNNGNLSSKK